MKQIKLTVKEQKMEVESVAVASDLVNQLELLIDSDWTIESAIFWNTNGRGKAYDVVVIKGKCTVPSEVLACKGDVLVDFVASKVEDGKVVKRMTSYPCKVIEVRQKIKLTGDNTVPLTPSQFEQYVKIVEGEVQKVTGMSVEAVMGEPGTEARVEKTEGEHGEVHLKFIIPKTEGGKVPFLEIIDGILHVVYEEE